MAFVKKKQFGTGAFFIHELYAKTQNIKVVTGG